jgi:hypothetical protein
MATSATVQPVSIGQVSLESVRRLLGVHPRPCLSLYMPTHRRVPENTVDLPAFRHLVEALEAALAPTLRREAVDHELRPFRLLEEDRGFWEHTRDGLAVLAADGAAQVFLLPMPVRPLAVVAPRFHTMPLLRIAASSERFNLLTLTSRAAHVYEGLATESGVERLDPVPLHAMPLNGRDMGGFTRDEVVDAETLQPHRVQRGMGPAGLAGAAAVHGGTGGRRDDIEDDTEIFLRAVDEIVHERVTRQSELPLVLVAPQRLDAAFRRLSKNRLLLAEGVAKDVHLVASEALPSLVAPVFAAARASRIAHDLEMFAAALSHGRGSADLAAVAAAAAEGRVATLLVERDRFERGRFDPATGAVVMTGSVSHDLSRTGDEPAIQDDDLLGTLAEAVVLHGGGIVVVDRDTLPASSGVAAIYRY